MKKHGLRLCLATGLLLLLTGCFSQSVDELYAPPRAPDDYLKLDDKINEVLNQATQESFKFTSPRRRLFTSVPAREIPVSSCSRTK